MQGGIGHSPPDSGNCLLYGWLPLCPSLSSSFFLHSGPLCCFSLVFLLVLGWVVVSCLVGGWCLSPIVAYWFKSPTAQIFCLLFWLSTIQTNCIIENVVIDVLSAYCASHIPSCNTYLDGLVVVCEQLGVWPRNASGMVYPSTCSPEAHRWVS